MTEGIVKTGLGSEGGGKLGDDHKRDKRAMFDVRLYDDDDVFIR